ncbi:MAG TPA: type IV pilus assembly protein PilM [Candidatus Saccharimonadales bacterium]|nr:type IV pilus assembly protein PilM [Candidatus Saccharimonadales bacterium]
MTKLFHHDKPIIGLDISQTGLRLMALDAKKWKVHGYGSLNLDPLKLQDGLNKGDDYLAKNLKVMLKKNILGHLPSNQVAVSVPTSKTYSRTLNLPLDAENNINEAVRLEADQYIPVPVDELNIDYEIIERNKEGLSVLISATPKKIVENIVTSLETAGLEVVFAEPGVSSIARLLRHTEDGNLPTIIVDIGAASTDIAIFNKTIRVSGGVAIGGNSLTIAISKKLDISLEEAHKIKVLDGLSTGPKRTKLEEAMEPSLNNICDELKKMTRYYTDRLEMKDKIEQIIMSGAGSNVPGMADYFTDKLETAVRVASPWQKLKFGKLPQPSKQNKPRFISATGLAFVTPEDVWK